LLACRSHALSNERYWTLVGGAAVVGLLARFYYVLEVARGRIELSGDSERYHLLAQGLAEGRGYVRPREPLQAALDIPTAEFPPAYPLLLATLDFIGIQSVTGQRLVSTLIGAVTIVLIGMLGTAVAGRTVGVIAAWIAALYPQLVSFDGSLLSEGLFVTLITASLLGVIRAVDATEPSPRRWWMLTSVATGIAVITRTEALLLVPLVLIPATFVPGDIAAWARRASLACAGSAATMSVWTLRNALTLGRFQPFTNNSGTALAGANCDAVYSGVQIGGWRRDCVPVLDPTSETESTFSDEARRLGLDYISDHLSELPRVVAARLGRTFGVWDVRTNLFFESLEGRDYEWLWAGWIVWILLAGFAAIGVVTLCANRVRFWPLLMPLVMVVVMSVITYGNQRFRMGAEPTIVVLAAVGLLHCARRVAAFFVPAGQRQLPDGSS
jgi:4-amino-4-deoxy-L-arabinose transferase-like glycosyltransferase